VLSRNPYQSQQGRENITIDSATYPNGYPYCAHALGGLDFLADLLEVLVHLLCVSHVLCETECLSARCHLHRGKVVDELLKDGVLPGVDAECCELVLRLKMRSRSEVTRSDDRDYVYLHSSMHTMLQASRPPSTDHVCLESLSMKAHHRPPEWLQVPNVQTPGMCSPVPLVEVSKTKEDKDAH